MRGELSLPVWMLGGFLLSLARIAGALAFLPLPGLRAIPEQARIILAVGFTMVLFPVWPRVPAAEWSMGRLAALVAVEAAVGIGIGLCVALLQESLLLASQIFGLQAGYSYASTIDPSTEADSSVLQIVSHLAGALLFFALELDGHLLRALGRSLELYPPGSFGLSLPSAEGVIRLGGEMLKTGLRLALPIVGVLFLADLAVALLSRIQGQLQLLALAFPVKMLVSMALLAAVTAGTLPVVYGEAARLAIEAIHGILFPG